MIDTVIFDAEGVVVDSEKLWDVGQQMFLGKRGFTYDRERIKPLIGGMSIADIIRKFQEIYGFDGDVNDEVKEHIGNMRGLFSKGLNFVDGFEEFFENNVRESYKHAIGTSMYTELMEVADAKLKLFELFDGNVFTIAEVGYRGKPNPDIFLYAAKRVGSEPSRCVVIEDAPNGIEAARRAGMRCIALTTTFPKEKLSAADLTVSDYSQIDLSRF